MIAFATVLLPHPDSPASPTISPGWIVSEIPFTAATASSPVAVLDDEPVELDERGRRPRARRRDLRGHDELTPRSAAGTRGVKTPRPRRLFYRRRGSPSSSMPKLMKTIERIVSEIASPGKRKCHHSPWSRVELFVAQKSVVPQLTLFTSPKPRNSSAASKKTAWMKTNAKPAAIRLSMFGISSRNTIRLVDSPSRARGKDEVSVRRSSAPGRAGSCVSIAQLVSPMIDGHHPRPGLLEEGRDHDQERQRRDDEEDVRDEIDAVVDRAAASRRRRARA